MPKRALMRNWQKQNQVLAVELVLKYPPYLKIYGVVLKFKFCEKCKTVNEWVQADFIQICFMHDSKQITVVSSDGRRAGLSVLITALQQTPAPAKPCHAHLDWTQQQRSAILCCTFSDLVLKIAAFNSIIPGRMSLCRGRFGADWWWGSAAWCRSSIVGLGTGLVRWASRVRAVTFSESVSHRYQRKWSPHLLLP